MKSRSLIINNFYTRIIKWMFLDTIIPLFKRFILIQELEILCGNICCFTVKIGLWNSISSTYLL